MKRVRGLVPRPALVDRLERGAAGPVTVVAAPAGSGKSVLVRSWLDGRGAHGRAAWVTVERSERDAQRFWGAVLAALRAADVPVEALAPTPEYDGDAVVRRLVADLASAGREVVLVIDDLHELLAAVSDGLTHLLDHLPETVHVVLITRRDPQLGLHRRRLAGELSELRSADLRFTAEEARAMLAAAGIALSDVGVERLHERTEGWVAGLRLAALSLAAHPDPEAFVVDFSGSERTVAEYLLAEVLDRQPPGVRRLLTRASLLERVNGALGDRLTGGSGAEHDLQALADAGGFVVALDPGRTWFRFHHLFADLLGVELRHAEPEAIPGLHRAAADWFAEHGHGVEAIHHAQAAGDRELAAGLLIDHYFSLTLDGRRATARALLEAFAPDPLAVSPEIDVVIAADQLAEGSLDRAAAQLALADRHADAVPASRRHRFDMALLVSQLSLARRLGDFRSVLDGVHPNTAREPRDGRDIAMYNDVRAMTLMNLGIVEAWSGRIEEGVSHLEQARELAERIGRPDLHVECQAHWANAMTWRSFTRARDASRAAIALAERHGWGADPVVGVALATLGTALLQAGRLDESDEWLARADATLRADLEPAAGFMLHTAHGGAHLAHGRYAQAVASYEDAERVGLRLITRSPLAMQQRSSKLQSLLGLGEVGAVRHALDRMGEAERDHGRMREVRAALALHEGEPQAASDALAPALDGTLEVEHRVVLVRSLLLEALARTALGDARASEAAVERALDVAEEDALILPFIHLPSRGLLERHPRHRTAHGAFVAEILDVLAGRPPAPAGAAPDALSDAELRVLRLLPTNLPAAGIAVELYVSVNTVKTHMRHVYAKLDAHTRIEAVQRARELGLLARSVRTR